jgi:hypothetical protein
MEPGKGLEKRNKKKCALTEKGLALGDCFRYNHFCRLKRTALSARANGL